MLGGITIGGLKTVAWLPPVSVVKASAAWGWDWRASRSPSWLAVIVDESSDIVQMPCLKVVVESARSSWLSESRDKWKSWVLENFQLKSFDSLYDVNEPKIVCNYCGFISKFYGDWRW
jgi:hypothetical protein